MLFQLIMPNEYRIIRFNVDTSRVLYYFKALFQGVKPYGINEPQLLIEVMAFKRFQTCVWRFIVLRISLSNQHLLQFHGSNWSNQQQG